MISNTELLFRRILYVCLLSAAPAFIFLVQAVILAPPLMILSTVFSFGWAVLTGTEKESIYFLAFFLAHFLLFAGLYWVLAWFLAKCLSQFKNIQWKIACTSALLCTIYLISQKPYYGGGGHGPSQLGPLQSLLQNEPHLISIATQPYLLTIVAAVLMAVVLQARTQFRNRSADD